MLRTGQMILFQAIKRHLFGEHFRLDMLRDKDNSRKYFNLLCLFMDNCPRMTAGPTHNPCPFGIHSICQEGKQINISPGQWYGPQMISLVLRNIMNKLDPIKNLKLHVCLDSNIFLDVIEDLVVN